MLVRYFFIGFAFVAWLVSLFTLVRPLGLSRRASVAISLVTLFASQKFVIYRVFGGSTFLPELPEAFLHWTGWAYAAFMFLFWLSLALWLAGAVRRALARRRAASAASDAAPSAVAVRRRTFIAGLASAGTAGWGVWEGVRTPDVRRVEIEVFGLPREFDGLRVVHLSDLHCGAAARREHIRAIVERVNGLSPDMVCITGDLIDGTVAAHREDLEPLSDLKSKMGTWACAGNHEFYSNYQEWRPVFEEFGIRMLDNSRCVFKRGRSAIALGGMPDVAGTEWRNGARHDPPDLKKTFRGVPPLACRILLYHRPLDIARHESARVHLQLSGHTHGGACIGVDALVARFNEGHVRGLYRKGCLAMYVSSGAGQWAGFPMRLGVPAEIAELVLRTPRV